MKLDFNAPLLNLKDEPIKNTNGSDILLNELLANALVSTAGKEDIVRIFDWGVTLQKTGKLDLSRADQSMLKGLIEGSDSLSIISKGRLLNILEPKPKEKEEELISE